MSSRGRPETAMDPSWIPDSNRVFPTPFLPIRTAKSGSSNASKDLMQEKGWLSEKCILGFRQVRLLKGVQELI